MRQAFGGLRFVLKGSYRICTTRTILADCTLRMNLANMNQQTTGVPHSTSAPVLTLLTTRVRQLRRLNPQKKALPPRNSSLNGAWRCALPILFFVSPVLHCNKKKARCREKDILCDTLNFIPVAILMLPYSKWFRYSFKEILRRYFSYLVVTLT